MWLNFKVGGGKGSAKKRKAAAVNDDGILWACMYVMLQEKCTVHIQQ